MQTFNKITWIVASVLTVLIPVLFIADILSTAAAIINGFLTVLLIAAAVSTFLLQNATGILRYAGLGFTWIGWLILALALHHFIGLSASWQAGLSLLCAGLICGIFSIQQHTEKRLRWIGIAACTLMFPVIAGIAAGIENVFFYQFGTFVLIIFSITAILAALRTVPKQ